MVVRNNRYALVPPCQFSTKILYYAPWAGSFAYLGCEPKLLFQEPLSAKMHQVFSYQLQDYLIPGGETKVLFGFKKFF